MALIVLRADHPTRRRKAIRARFPLWNKGSSKGLSVQQWM